VSVFNDAVHDRAEFAAEDAAAFVDIVKFAMQRLPAPTVAAAARKFIERASLESARVRRLNRVRQVFCATVLAACALAVPAATYSLLGKEAPDFALHAVAGANVRLSEHRGEVVVLSFWGSRCAPCAMQLSALDRSFRTYTAAGLQVFGINVDDDQSRALENARSISVGFPLLLDPGKSVSRSYDIDNLPMTVLIDRGGAVRHVHRDYSSKDEALYLQQLRTLLNE
jgi:peroxiredoxin